MITECPIHLNILITSDAYFKLVLCFRISNYFPIVDATWEPYIGKNISKNIGFLFQINMCFIFTKNNVVAKSWCIPAQTFQIWQWTLCSRWSNLSWHWSHNFKELLVVTIMLTELWEYITSIRATWNLAHNWLVRFIFAELCIKTIRFHTTCLVLLDFFKCEYFLTIWVWTFDIEVVVHSD